MDDLQLLCQFEHPGFAALGNAMFRLTSSDRVAALALQIDHADVIIPLKAVAQLFGVVADSKDGVMLRLVERSLQFVGSLQLGDALPSEVVTGKASWQPRDHHRKTAAAKLHLHLVRWIGGTVDVDEANITPQMLIVAVDDPAIRPRVEEGLRRAAVELGLSGGEAVAALIETLGDELAYFEALREWLLNRACAMSDRLARIAQETTSLGSGRRETLVQVLRLAITASVELKQQFDEVEGQTSDVLGALKHMERQRVFLRPHRDRLFTTLLGWEKLLGAWAAFPAHAVTTQEADGLWRIIDESYRFLAPRYMPVQEWQHSAPLTTERPSSVRTTLVW